MQTVRRKINARNEISFLKVAKKDFIRNRSIYLMALPVLAFFIVFSYIPIYGAIIAFKDYAPIKGILGSPWVGLKYFGDFFSSIYFLRVIRNTLLLNVYNLIFAFPAPIILAILLNEIRNVAFKRLVQTVTYLPHFVALTVVCGMIVGFLARDGLINQIISIFGVEPIPFLIKKEWFRAMYTATDIWQEVGWSSIIFLAALANINPQLYEASTIDGAGRFKQILHITIPGILSTIVILLIFRMGSMLSVGFEKIILLYNGNTYETADVISTYVFRKGLLENNYSYSTAVGLFNSVINFIFLLLANKISKKINQASLW